MTAAVALALRWQPAAGCRQMEMHMCRPQHGPSLRLRQTPAGTSPCRAVHGALSLDACAYVQLTAARAGWCTGPADAALGFAATATGVKAQSTVAVMAMDAGCTARMYGPLRGLMAKIWLLFDHGYRAFCALCSIACDNAVWLTYGMSRYLYTVRGLARYSQYINVFKQTAVTVRRLQDCILLSVPSS